MKNKKIFKRVSACAAAIVMSLSSLAAVGAEELKGDVNTDGALTAVDIKGMIEYLLMNKKMSGEGMKNADMNGDGRVDVIDFIMLKRIFVDGDITNDVTVSLNGDSISAEGQGIEVEGTKVTINKSGTYSISGAMTVDAQIIINTSSEDQEAVEITLNDVSMTNSSDTPCIMIENADKTKITFLGENSLKNTFDQVSATSAAIYAKDDITFTKKSEGSLDISTNACIGIYCNNDIKFNGGNIKIKTDSDQTGVASSDGVKAKGNVEVSGSDISVNAGGDGIKSTKNAVAIQSGNVSVKSGKDAIQAETTLTINDGCVAASGDRGLTSAGTLNISGGSVLATGTEKSLLITGTSELWENTFSADLNEVHAKNETIKVFDKEYIATKKYQYIFISDSSVKPGEKSSLLKWYNYFGHRGGIFGHGYSIINT